MICFILEYKENDADVRENAPNDDAVLENDKKDEVPSDKENAVTDH